MAKIPTFLCTVSLTMLVTCASLATPLNLDTTKKYSSFPIVTGFKYWYGDPSWGKIIYLGSADIAGFETELHLDFKNSKITTATMILGPAGLDNENCVKEYKRIIKIINKKYGHYQYQKTEKDPLMDDLVAVSACHPIQVGMYSIDTIWKVKKTKIISTLVGEDGDFFIEIEYQFSPKVNARNKELLKLL